MAGRRAYHFLYAFSDLPSFYRSFRYISRLFAYFFIRWEDEPNLKGSRLEKKIEGMLGQRVTWAGPHIQTGKTWRKWQRK